MSIVDLRREGDVFVLAMKNGENRFNRASIDAINGALDEVEASSGPAALVTVGEGKFYSNGLDLTWMAELEDAGAFVRDVEFVFARIMALSMVTAAAINGHAFAGGAMLALAHDYRIMRAGRGYFCLPEIDINIPFTPGMNALICARISGAALRETTLTGVRLDGADAARLGIVDAAVSDEAEVVARAVAAVAPHAGKNRATMQAIKREQFKSVLALLGSGGSTFDVPEQR
jgi:enoyl-CoA hydratase/carnithine racemase